MCPFELDDVKFIGMTTSKVEIFSAHTINSDTVRFGDDLSTLLYTNSTLPRMALLDHKGHGKHANVNFDFDIGQNDSAFTSFGAHWIEALNTSLDFGAAFAIAWFARIGIRLGGAFTESISNSDVTPGNGSNIRTIRTIGIRIRTTVISAQNSLKITLTSIALAFTIMTSSTPSG